MMLAPNVHHGSCERIRPTLRCRSALYKMCRVYFGFTPSSHRS